MLILKKTVSVFQTWNFGTWPCLAQSSEKEKLRLISNSKKEILLNSVKGRTLPSFFSETEYINVAIICRNNELSSSLSLLGFVYNSVF